MPRLTSRIQRALAALRGEHTIVQLAPSTAVLPIADDPGHEATPGPEEVIALNKLTDAYGRRLSLDVGRGLIVVALFAAFGGYLLLLTSYGNGPAFTAPTIDGALTLAGFGLLAAIVTALQIAARGSADASPGPRRQFLARTAYSLIPCCLGLGVYASGQAVLLAAPRVVDPVRTAGPLVIGWLLAMLAADGAAAAVTMARDEQSRNALKVETVTLLRERRLALASGTLPPRSGAAFVELIMLVLLCAAGVVITGATGMVTSSRGLVLLGLGLLIGAVVSCAAVYYAYKAALLKSWLEMSFAIAGWITFFLLFTTQVLTDTLSTSTSETAGHRVGWALFTWFFLGVTTTALALRSAGTSKHGTRGCLRQLAVGMAERAERRAESPSPSANDRTPERSMAILGTFLSPLFPIGLILAGVAQERLRDENPLALRRTRCWIRWAQWTSWVVACVALLATLLLALTSAPVN